MGQRIVILFSMNKSIIIIFLFSVLISCSKSEDSLINPDGITDHEITSHSNNRVSSLLMTKSEYRDWVNNDEFRNSERRKSLTNDLYKKYADKYDFIFFILNEPSIPENLSYYGMLVGVSNNIQGTGQEIYDYSLDYGSNGKLKAVMQLTGLEYLRNGPALHELAHNWANFGIDTHYINGPGTGITSFNYKPHWGFTGGSSRGQLGGFDQSTLVDNGNNSYTVNSFGGFANGGNGIPFNELELYMMGMIPSSQVSEFDVFTEITSFSSGSNKFNFTANSRKTYDAQVLENLLGKRVPNSKNSQKNFKILAVVITDTPLSDEEWNKVDVTAEWFSKKGEDESSLYNFWEATNGIGSIDIEN